MRLQILILFSDTVENIWMWVTLAAYFVSNTDQVGVSCQSSSVIHAGVGKVLHAVVSGHVRLGSWLSTNQETID